MIPYPAWANTGTQRWLYAMYYNSTAEQILKFVLFLVIFGAALVVWLIDVTSEEMARYRRNQYVPPESAPLVEPAGEPAPTEAADPYALQPIAVDFASTAFGGPPDFATIATVRQQAGQVANGNNEGDRQLVDTAMSRLLRMVETRPDAAQRSTNQQRFFEFLGRALPASNEQRNDQMRMLSAHLREDVYDAEAACEWSWLALLENQRDYARSGFLRTIWADPQYSCGWLGYGTVVDDTPLRFGSLVMAERLQLGGPGDYDARDLLVEATFVPNGQQVQRWRIIDARARVRAAQLRNEKVPPEIEQRAKATLP